MYFGKQKINKQKNKIKLFFEKDKKLRIKVPPKADKAIKKKMFPNINLLIFRTAPPPNSIILR